MDALSLGALLDDAGGVSVHEPGRVWTAAELRARRAEIADALAGAGVGAGDAVAVALPNGGELVATLFAVWAAGAAYVPLNPRLTDTEMARIVADVDPAAIVTGSGTEVRSATRRYDTDVALVQFTSGTTGPPQPVPLLHSKVGPLLDTVVASLRGSTARSAAPTPNLVPVSLSLWAGLYQVLFALRVGADLVVMHAFEPVEFARLVAEHGVRSVVLPPAAMATLVAEERVTSLDPLRYVRSITAPLSPVQALRFRDRFGIAVLNSYGQTELGGEIVGWTAADSREFGETKLGAAGRPHPGIDVRVDGDSGELQVRTPTLDVSAAASADRLTPDGWFRTGDTGRVDTDGFVWIEGRLSDMVNRGGLKVQPAEVEEVLRLLPAIADVAVVGVPDDRLGEVPWAFVVVRPSAAPPAEDELARHCREHLAPYKIPVRVLTVDELPRNEIGKVLARELVARAVL